MPDASLLESLVVLSRRAGDAIHHIYRSGESLEIERKSDDSPVTAADYAANRLISDALPKILDVPVISEESYLTPFEERRKWQRYWLVDPLDGTREFIKGSGEFTVNIALIDHGQPVAGVICLPTTGDCYVGYKGMGAYKHIGDEKITLQGRKVDPALLRVMGSRRKVGSRRQRLMARLGEQFSALDIQTCGSSLKMCLIAEGKADIYAQYGPTCEWDTAAAQIIIEEAGGALVGADFEPLRYNTKESIINPSFFVLGDRVYPWSEVGV